MSAISAAPPLRATLPIPQDRDTAPERRRAAIALVGASGYTGQEFARLAIAHPGLDLAVLCSREHAGRPANEMLSGLDPRLSPLPEVVDPAGLERLLAEGAFDTLVVCLPHDAWRTMVHECPAMGRVSGSPAAQNGGAAPAAAPGALSRPDPAPGGLARLIDLSSDFRDGSEGYVYGLPEAFRAEIPAARRIANPGCYPTAATIALLPALEGGWLAGPVMVGALSGVSGAGRSPSLRTSFVELDGGAALYRAGTEHGHVAEMERNFERIAGKAGLDVGFAPQLAPMARGILLTATAPLAEPLTPADAHEAYLERFADEPFVRVLEPGQWPETRSVKTSNRCDVAVTTIHHGRTLLAAAALDNLVKGAAGQAVQNLNLMLGWPENWGLPVHGTPW